MLVGILDVVMRCGLSLKSSPDVQVGNLKEQPSQSHAVGMSAGELFSEDSDIEE